jgi:hypothetical protein
LQFLIPRSRLSPSWQTVVVVVDVVVVVVVVEVVGLPTAASAE